MDYLIIFFNSKNADLPTPTPFGVDLPLSAKSTLSTPTMIGYVIVDIKELALGNNEKGTTPKDVKI